MRITDEDLDRLDRESRELRAHFRRRDVPLHIAVAAMLETLAVVAVAVAPGDPKRSRAAMNECIKRLREAHERVLSATGPS